MSKWAQWGNAKEEVCRAIAGEIDFSVTRQTTLSLSFLLNTSEKLLSSWLLENFQNSERGRRKFLDFCLKKCALVVDSTVPTR